jgi:EAL domain-containing protein (putative c-di-GMP-specific phosphodiesterase class I)
MWCADCESVNDYFFETTYFWFFLPTIETFGKLAVLCGDADFEAYQANSHCIRVKVPKSNINTFLTQLNGCLDGPEFGKTKVTTTQTPDEPNLHSVGMLTTAEILVRRHQAGWLQAAIENENYQSWFQPIVRASSRDVDTAYAHEALFRVYDESGAVMPPGMVFPLAEQSDLLFSIDLVARRSAVEYAARGKPSGKLFINFNPSSIYDPSYCLRSTAAAISEIGLKPQDIVFEVTETHQATDLNHLKGILAFYRSNGFGVALDDIGSGWSGLNLLEQLRPDYVKIDMELIRNIDRNSYKQNIVQHLINIAKGNRTKVVAEGIETQAEADTVSEMGADLLQGFLIAKPRAFSEKVCKAEKAKIADSMKPLKDAAKLK